MSATFLLVCLLFKSTWALAKLGKIFISFQKALFVLQENLILKFYNFGFVNVCPSLFSVEAAWCLTLQQQCISLYAEIIVFFMLHTNRERHKLFALKPLLHTTINIICMMFFELIKLSGVVPRPNKGGTEWNMPNYCAFSQ